MTCILDMASGKEYPGEKLDCPNQGSVETRLPVAARDDDHPALQLATVEANASAKQPASTLPGFAVDSLLTSLEE